MITNQLYIEDLYSGQEAKLTKVISDEDIHVFAELSGDHNPVHLDDEYASKTIFKSNLHSRVEINADLGPKESTSG